MIPAEPDDLQTPDSIGERIRSARKAAGVNQATLAERVGVSQPAVANWESGVHDPRRLALAKIAEALGVSPEWLAGGARSAVERDTHPAAAYIRRPIQHTPVISFADAARLLAEPQSDPHSVAQDYIPVTYGASRLFALFVDDDAVNLAFPKETLVVFDYSDRRLADGAFFLFATDGAPIIRRWRENPIRLEPYSSNDQFKTRHLVNPPRVIGRVRVSIRVH
ncbi:MAG: helix-turn-helix transcriptional regulator [Parvularculaceae bacterium]